MTLLAFFVGREFVSTFFGVEEVLLLAQKVQELNLAFWEVYNSVG
jgi:hypothetical protein